MASRPLPAPCHDARPCWPGRSGGEVEVCARPKAPSGTLLEPAAPPRLARGGLCGQLIACGHLTQGQHQISTPDPVSATPIR